MNGGIKDSLSYMDRVGNDNDIENVRELDSLTDPISDCK